MSKLPTVSGAQIRGTTYHFNLPIPTDIRHLYGGKAAYRGTMKTADPKEAERQVRKQRTLFDEQLSQKRRDEDRARLAELLTDDQRSQLEDIGGHQNLLTHIKELREIAAFGFVGLDDHDDDREPNAMERLHVEAQDDADRVFLSRVQAQTRTAKRMAAALDMEVPAAPKGLNEGVTGLPEVAERFMESKSYTAHNCEKVRYTLRRWQEFHGDLPLERIARWHINEFDEALKQLPAATGKHRNLTFRQSAAQAKHDGTAPISVKTRETMLLHLKSLTAFALDKLGVISTDPFVGYTTDKPKQKASAAKKKSVKPYTPAQVRQILDHAKTFDRATIDYWLPLLAAYTGARMEELAQLNVDDVSLIGNHWCIRITDLDDDQKVKNLHSVRTVPVPPVVMREGFLDFADSRRQAGAKLLFQEFYKANGQKAVLQDVKPNERGRFSDNYGTRFRRKVREPLGLTSEGMQFHSLRHSWTDAARRAKIDPEIRRMIAGRLEDADPTEAKYGGDDLLAEKLEALNAIAPYIASP